ncbi:penicillin-binding transpeptidase domain-containing protein [Verrucomicrobium spinosum]|uniref:penicillin-binding transpeptidase domain-containing protein n=1 Tax=Verrucomicrobium spinosum TaxID=2736 RepID=UPI00094653C8|nr:penicillin-binding transpeptidase domain-containing protein [Verrucomicrobium spinosum]
MLPVNTFATLLLLATATFSIDNLHANSPSPLPARGDIRDRNGIVLATDKPDPKDSSTTPPPRRYPFQSLASHVLGAVTQPQPWQPPFGIDGVEKMLNDDLASTPAQTDHSNSGKSGQDVWLTIDARHQFIVENALRDANVGRGTAVLMDVTSGQIFAMASLPSFDPNLFVPQISEATFEAYRRNPSIPMLNRATTPFTPGASFMLVTALAAATSGHAIDVHACDGVFQAGSKSLPCWIRSKGGTHGQQTLDKAMENSCGLYFYGLTLSMGYDKIERLADLAGLRSKPGTGLPGEAAGFIPGPSWLKTQTSDLNAGSHSPWTDASSATNSVGSGRIAITPLHMTTIAATIANGGTVWKPELVRHVGEQETKLYRKTNSIQISNLKDHGLSAEGLSIIREACASALPK